MGEPARDNGQDNREFVVADEFAALFAQLDRRDDVAPIDGGLHQLMQTIVAARLARNCR